MQKIEFDRRQKRNNRKPPLLKKKEVMTEEIGTSTEYKGSPEQSLQHQINPEDQDQAFIQIATHQFLSGNHEDAADSHTSGADLLLASQLCR